MDLVQFSIMLFTFIGLFIWNRTKNRADKCYEEAKLMYNRILSEAMHRENKELMQKYEYGYS